MADVRFEEFFTWLSASASAVVAPTSAGGENTTVVTPTPDPWATGFVIGTSN